MGIKNTEKQHYSKDNMALISMILLNERRIGPGFSCGSHILADLIKAAIWSVSRGKSLIKVSGPNIKKSVTYIEQPSKRHLSSIQTRAHIQAGNELFVPHTGS